MTTKSVLKPTEKPKSIFAKVGENKIWKKIFSDQIDYQKIEERKREMQMKYQGFRF